MGRNDRELPKPPRLLRFLDEIVGRIERRIKDALRGKRTDEQRPSRPVVLEVKHVHGTTEPNTTYDAKLFSSKLSETTWTEYYNTFRCTVAKPTSGFSSASETAYCPFCRRTIEIRVQSDPAAFLGGVFAVIFLFAPFVVVWWLNGFQVSREWLIPTVVVTLFVWLPFTASVGDSDPYSAEGHQTKVVDSGKSK